MFPSRAAEWQHSSVPFERDPLSVRYDAAAGRLIGEAISKPGAWVVRAVARPGDQGRAGAWLARMGIRLDSTDAGGLTAYERAYQRSMYYVLNGGGGGRKNPAWSLQRQWGAQTNRGRLLAVRVSRPDVARRAVRRKPRSEQWYRNPDLQSGGQGSPKQRFG